MAASDLENGETPVKYELVGLGAPHPEPPGGLIDADCASVRDDDIAAQRHVRTVAAMRIGNVSRRS
jgi:hypothetical protein